MKEPTWMVTIGKWWGHWTSLDLVLWEICLSKIINWLTPTSDVMELLRRKLLHLNISLIFWLTMRRVIIELLSRWIILFQVMMSIPKWGIASIATTTQPYSAIGKYTVISQALQKAVKVTITPSFKMRTLGSIWGQWRKNGRAITLKQNYTSKRALKMKETLCMIYSLHITFLWMPTQTNNQHGLQKINGDSDVRKVRWVVAIQNNCSK